MRLFSLLAAILMLAIATSPGLRLSLRQSISLVPRSFGYLASRVDIRALSTTKPVFQSQHSLVPPATETPLGSVSSTTQPEPTSPATTMEELPPLTAEEFQTFNRLAELMEYYHNHFRHTWTTLSTACTTNKRPSNLSIRQFINLGLSFAHSLTMHHNIEEVHVFPLLGTKMPRFRDQAHMKLQHAQIHAGLDVFESYFEACRSGERELRLGELGEIMKGFGEVLWQHLDDEVKELGAENMRKFWTRAEMKRLSF